MPANRHWTWREVRRLRQWYPTHTQPELATKLGRSLSAVTFKAGQLALRKTPEQWAAVCSRVQRRRYNHV